MGAKRGPEERAERAAKRLKEREERKEVKKAAQRRVRGEDCLDWVWVAVDRGVGSRLPGVPPQCVHQTEHPVPYTVTWRVVHWKQELGCVADGGERAEQQYHALHVDKQPVRIADVVGTASDVRLVAAVLSKDHAASPHITTYLDALVAHYPARRIVIIVRGAPRPVPPLLSAFALSHPEILALRVELDPSNYLSSLTSYIAKAPYKTHAFENTFAAKVHSEKDPQLVYLRMLELVPRLGPTAARAIAARYPTLTSLLSMYAALPSQADRETALASLPCAEGVDESMPLGPALSRAVYTAFSASC